MISFIFFLVPIVPISSTIHNIILSSTKTGQEISHHHRSSSSSPREEKARCSSLISSGENKTKNWRRTKSPSPQCRLRHKKLRLIIIAIMGAAASTTPRAPPASSPPSCFARAASAVCGPLLSSSPCPTAANTAFNTARLKKIPMSYLSKTSQPSFLRNGKVGTKRGLDGHDQPNFGCDEEVLDVNVRDLRTLSSCERTPELGKEGFVLRRFHEEVDKFSAEFERERRERAAAGHQNANGVHRVVAEPGATAKKVRRVSSRKLTEDQIPDIEAERGMTPLQILAVAKAYVALDDPPSPVVEEEDAGPPGQHDPRINLSFADINPSIFRSLKPSYSAKAMELSYSEKPIDFKDADEVILRYYPQVIQFIKQVTGASEVFPFDHNLRFADFATTDKEIANSKVQVQKPIGNVHTDYTIHSAPRRLLDLIRPPTTNDVWGKYLQEGRSLVPEELVLGGPSARKGGEEKGRGAGVRRGSEEELSHAPVVGAGPGGNWNFVASPRDESGRGAGEDGPGRRGSVDDKVGAANTRKPPYSRYIMLNVWKSCAPADQKIEQAPLALCASDSVDFEQDFATFEIQYAQRIGENWWGRVSKNVKNQKWYYYADMDFGDALLFKQWDSWGKIATGAGKRARECAAAAEGREVDADSEHGILDQSARNTCVVLDNTANFAAPEGQSLSSDCCMHCAISDPDAVENPKPRQSIEVRAFAFFE